ncbi:hypothetical protein MDOR_34950 [Mycolicibacterium doricum]|uniref:Lipoprotein n=1 Tax=Mycolicibacterium doricum TaxID=126673 RepID=A0A1X1T2K8_9MYCO|nr:hypothetical protein [Mycolicibacterium doricum]MCV7270105.1 hypothetical protein [Mycolicibacterium doricum]ORV38482.1 hypothetical protein AWC01_14510 [Mycolicibacterium doricum]BBZ09326.1 hypothetical protein MDOR_34950 [Mycolicibacterium doricum]
MQTTRLLTAGFAAITATVVVVGCSSGSSEEPATTPPAGATTANPSGSTPQSTPGIPAPDTTPTTSVSMMPNPNGDGSMVPCEGTICTNPNHGAGDDPYGDAPIEPGQTEMQGPGDAPPEPGQTDMQGPADDGPPEPGQTDMQGPGS